MEDDTNIEQTIQSRVVNMIRRTQRLRTLREYDVRLNNKFTRLEVVVIITI